MPIPVMCSTNKLPVKTHDHTTDHMVNLSIQNGKNWEDVGKQVVKPTLPEASLWRALWYTACAFFY